MSPNEKAMLAEKKIRDTNTTVYSAECTSCSEFTEVEIPRGEDPTTYLRSKPVECPFCGNGHLE